jgi:class 3 adenylate cyclase/predicted ATPase
MSDIRKWLAGLGLESYAETFAAADIDSEVLAELDDGDLEKLGLSLGHRKKVLKAIRALDHETPAAPRQEAERRQITVMFCDLVGSTALSEKLDPEDLRALMAAYRKAAGDAVGRYDGHVAQYLGDGVMAYFGWPRAHEDDGERAVRAGLDIVAAVKHVEAAEPLRLRIGIATGPVVVGESVDDDAEANKLAIGETPNLAARLQGLAGANEIVISQGTHDLIRGAFDYDDLGMRELKGMAEPVRVWRVRGASRAEGRFEAQAVGGLTPFVGRETEIAMLLERWRQAKDGEGQVVLLEGEPGIGKSRITQVLRERLADEPHTRLRYQCSPYYANSAFYPVIGQLARAAGFAREDSPEARLDKLETLLAQSADDVATVAPLMAAMLSLPTERYPPLTLSPQRQKDDTIAALASRVTALATREPLLLLFEDAHWCDPTTLETLSAVIGQIEAAPVLLVITYRPEFDPPWTAHGHVTAQSLARLAKRYGAEMVARVTGGKALPDEVLDQIVAKTDGIPLFVEELTKTVLEAGYLKETGDHYALDGPLPPLAIPSTLQDSLMARLDRLSPVKEVAQTGACIGREFSYELLAAVSPLRDNELQDALQQLVNSDLIFRRGTPPNSAYSFKHALVQDAAYESLLKSRRQQFHKRIAETLESEEAGLVTTQPGLLAHHFSAAGIADRAIGYWQAAAQQSMQTLATGDAITCLNRALESVASLPEEVDRDNHELDIRIALSMAHLTEKGWAAEEIPETLLPAGKLCERHGDIVRKLTVEWNLLQHQCICCDFHAALEKISGTLAIADKSADMRLKVMAWSMATNVYWAIGQHRKAECYGAQLIEAYDVERDASLMAAAGGLDAKVMTYGAMTYLYWIMGRPDAARAAVEAQLQHARSLGHALNLIFALNHGCDVLAYLGEADLLIKRSSEARAIAREQGNQFVEVSVCGCHGGIGYLNAGDFETADTELTTGFELWAATGGKWQLGQGYTLRAEAAMGLGQLDRARDLIQAAIEVTEETGHVFWSAETHRVHGEILGHPTFGGATAAEASFRRAIDTAKVQEAKMLELRAATSLARLWQSQGKTAEARDLLAPVYGWFTEGFDTPDLIDAKALLDELAA